jgi:RimJ/RimL family protein N-acetyltransferase
MPNLPYPFTLDHARKLLNSSNRNFRKGTAFRFGIVPADTAEVVGVINLFNINRDDHNAEVGYWLGKRHWGRGLATEALGLVLRFAFREMKLHRVYAVTHSTNSPSISLLERYGFTREARWREGSFLGRRWADVYAYGLLTREWEQTQAADGMKGKKA